MVLERQGQGFVRKTRGVWLTCIIGAPRLSPGCSGFNGLRTLACGSLHNLQHSSAARKEDAAASVGLPSGATWATQATRQQHQQYLHQQEVERQAQQAPVVADESAWPSLADTIPTNSAASSSNTHHKEQQQKQVQQLRQSLHQQQQRQQQREQQAQREREQQQQRERERDQDREREQLARRPSLSAAASMDRVASSSSIEHMSQDPVVPPEQLGLQHGRIPQPPFAPTSQALADVQQHTAQFSTNVHGLSRNVSIALPASAAVDPYPEAGPLLASLSSGIKAGGINSKDAAAQLVALLKHKEAQQGRMQSLLAAGRAPPGFAVPPPQQQQQQQLPATAVQSLPPTSGISPPPSSVGAAQPSNGCLTPLDSPVVPTPSIGRYQPIGKPIAPPPPPQQPPQSNGNGVHSMHSTHQSYANGNGLGTYSMWSGVPGIDLTPTYSPLGSSMWSGLGSCTPPGIDPAAPVSSAYAHPQVCFALGPCC